MQTRQTLDTFKNEPFTDFSVPENADAMLAAIEKVRGELGREYPVFIGGEEISLPSKFRSINPANTSEVVGVFSEGDSDVSLVEKAITAAGEAFKTWRNVPHTERAEYLFRIADIMRQRKHELSAWMIF
jgi:1-pyrroline-5-carboxylate dehydrogenase